MKNKKTKKNEFLNFIEIIFSIIATGFIIADLILNNYHGINLTWFYGSLSKYSVYINLVIFGIVFYLWQKFVRKNKDF